MIYLTSDLHLGHAKDFIYKDRGFDSIEEHDQFIIDTWQRKISKSDEVYILGDVSWFDGNTTKRILDSLPGKKYLIRGNHDSRKSTKLYESCFEWIRDYYELKWDNQKFVLFHYPIESWNGKFHGRLHFFGHIHNSEIISYIPNRLNIGIDKYPEMINIREAIEECQKLLK